jgi:hypothetical protein
MEIARGLLKKGIEKLDTEDFGLCYSYFEEARHIIHKNLEMKSELEEKLIYELQEEEKNIIQLINRTAAYKKYYRTRQNFQNYLNNDSELVQDIEDLLDEFRASLSECGEQNSDLKSLIHKEIAKIYFIVLKDYERAEKYCKISVDLIANTIRIDKLEKCYEWCNSTIREITKIRERDLVEKSRKLLEEIRIELEPLFHSLENIMIKHSMEDSISIITEKYPPGEKIIFHVHTEIKKNGLRKTLTKLSTLYHPDKYSDLTREDKKRKMLMQEIAKILNNYKNDLQG